jgi:hypothetical protein
MPESANRAPEDERDGQDGGQESLQEQASGAGIDVPKQVHER